MWVACVVTVSHYFRDKRAFAMGLAICGSGIGTFIFAPLKLSPIPVKICKCWLTSSEISISCIKHLGGVGIKDILMYQYKQIVLVPSDVLNASEVWG
jgi:hypothetical protein